MIVACSRDRRSRLRIPQDNLTVVARRRDVLVAKTRYAAYRGTMLNHGALLPSGWQVMPPVESRNIETLEAGHGAARTWLGHHRARDSRHAGWGIAAHAHRSSDPRLAIRPHKARRMTMSTPRHCLPYRRYRTPTDRWRIFERSWWPLCRLPSYCKDGS